MKDGIYTDISIDDYHKNSTHISATKVKYAKKSLKLLDWYNRGLIVQEDKPHFSFGNAFELALLDKNEFANRVAIMPDSKFVADALAEKPDLKVPRSSVNYKAALSKWQDANQGKYVILDKGPTESYEAIELMLESCYQDSVIRRLIEGTEYQLSLFWTDPETGLRLKTRPDICKRKKNVVVNVKTTADGSPEAFSREMAKHDYPIQAAIEIEGCLQTGLMQSVDHYFWLVVEKVPPYCATIYEFAPKDIELYTDQIHYYFHKIRQAQKQNLWPGYSDRADNQYGILTVEIPLWYRQ